LSKIQNLINQVKVINEKHEAVKKINGENFNIFSILKLETDEVKTHSYFIYELLNPAGSHNQGDIFLKLFLKQVLTKEEYKNKGKIQEIKREDPTDENRRIDFTIKTSNIFIAIEMKIHAKDQNQQLSDYHKHIQKKRKTNKLFYLTLDGNEADDKSTKGIEVDKDYFRLSFYDDIHTWIERCIEKTATIPNLREGLVHYRNLIRKLTNQMGDEMAKDIIDIIRTPADMEAMHTIYTEYAKVLAQKESDFWFEVYDEIEKHESIKSFNIRYDSDSRVVDERLDYNEIVNERKNKHSLLGLSLKKEIEEYQINCYVYQMSSENHITMSVKISKNGKNIKLFQKDKILNTIGFEKKYREVSRWFYLKNKIKFYGSGEPTFDLFDKTKFDELVKNTANEVVETLERILEKEDELLAT